MIALRMLAGPIHKSCPLCQSEALKRRWEVNGYTIARCQGCSLVFVQNILSPEELAAHYAACSDPAYSDDNRECLDYYYHQLRKRIEARVPQRGKILDVGCSGGWFLEAMQGWECHGCEISPVDAGIARRRFGDRIFTGTLEDHPQADGYFDVIAMQDVFDHCREPLPVLAKCRRMLKEGGLLVIKVHNISCLYARIARAGFYAILPPSHLFYYDRRTLALAAAKSGFEVVETRFIAHLLRIDTVFMRLSRGDKASPFYRMYSALARRPLGKVKVRKNLHDIITVFAVKRSA
jgi:SAM-dependent methyltransferase